MTLKLSLQGLLIYLTLFFYLATLLATFLARRAGPPSPAVGRAPQATRAFLFALAFASAAASVAWRGVHTGHAPMQNLFEFFLCMAAALPPLALWNRLRHGLDTVTQDALLGIVILIPAGFVFSEEARQLPPALQSPLFVPHVAAYVTGYVLLARAALMAIPLFRRAPAPPRLDTAVAENVSAGFLLVTLGLALGSVWGKVCWGHYWQWDPKEMWSLATWFIYAAFFHFRLRNGSRSPRVLAALLWLGLLFIVLTLTWINLSRLFSGMHTYA